MHIPEKLINSKTVKQENWKQIKRLLEVYKKKDTF